MEARAVGWHSQLPINLTEPCAQPSEPETIGPWSPPLSDAVPQVIRHCDEFARVGGLLALHVELMAGDAPGGQRKCPRPPARREEVEAILNIASRRCLEVADDPQIFSALPTKQHCPLVM
jgi:hypothetical protein